ncbi:hypothetical protein EYR38_005120 [Pleurotus pulmonarius]|nr:hypothetical protein EYR38_005120 [Pleurotus pulmonarius]
MQAILRDWDFAEDAYDLLGMLSPTLQELVLENIYTEEVEMVSPAPALATTRLAALRRLVLVDVVHPMVSAEGIIECPHLEYLELEWFYNPDSWRGACVVSYAISKLLRRRSSATTPLLSPPSPSWLLGASKMLASSDDEMRLYEEWANKYGRVYRVPGPLGSSRIVLCDPKAVASFYSKETFTYVRSALGRIFIRTFFGGGLLSTEGETHRRQRKALAPAFSNAAIRELTDVFFDLAHKCKSIWDDILDSHPEGVVIDVQRWMSNITLDSIGIAGFSHNFGQLDGKDSDVAVAFDSFGDSRNALTMFILLLSHYLPFLAALPTKHNRAIRRLRKSLSDISYELLEQTRKESQGGVDEKSIVGLLIKAQEGAALTLTQEEVMAQLNVILFAGYETTSTSLTWALIELCRFPEKQQKLRDEVLSEFRSSDPTWDQLMTAIPYLDAFVHETLRMHPPLVMTTRKAAKDDVIPLSAPIVTSDGQTVSSISIAKGTTVSVPIHLMHQAEWFWGSDAKEFYPERWLEPSFGEKNEVQGHRHLLSFLDGPRTCLGKNFALAELKAVLSVLVRNFIFEFDGPEPKIEEYVSILPRPKFAGEDGAKVPLRATSCFGIITYPCQRPSRLYRANPTCPTLLSPVPRRPNPMDAILDTTGWLKADFLHTYITVSSIVLVIYDYLLMVSSEARYVWQANWGIGKFLYLLSRYPILVFALTRVYGVVLLMAIVWSKSCYKGIPFSSMMYTFYKDGLVYFVALLGREWAYSLFGLHADLSIHKPQHANALLSVQSALHSVLSTRMLLNLRRSARTDLVSVNSILDPNASHERNSVSSLRLNILLSDSLAGASPGAFRASERGWTISKKEIQEVGEDVLRDKECFPSVFALASDFVVIVVFSFPFAAYGLVVASYPHN